MAQCIYELQSLIHIRPSNIERRGSMRYLMPPLNNFVELIRNKPVGHRLPPSCSKFGFYRPENVIEVKSFE